MHADGEQWGRGARTVIPFVGFRHSRLGESPQTSDFKRAKRQAQGKWQIPDHRTREHSGDLSGRHAVK